MKETTSTFRISGNSWGTYIEITGRSEMILEDTINVYFDILNVRLSTREGSGKILAEQIKYLNGGFNSVLPRLKSCVKSSVKIKIKEVTIVLTDYQKEGLHYAIIQWLAEHFDFPIPNFNYNFYGKSSRFPDINY